METNYRGYQISVGATERRNGEMATEACIFQGYQPVHSLFAYIGQNTLALELAQQWIDQREGGALPVSNAPPAFDPACAQRRGAALAERGRLDQEAKEAEIQLLMHSAADSARRIERRFFGNHPVTDRLAYEQIEGDL